MTEAIDVEQAVADRMERGRRILKTKRPRYDAILMEAGIRWRPKGCPPGTRSAQWQKLIEFSAAKHITIRIIPLDAELVVAPMIGFVMVTLIDPAEPQVVRMETPATHMAFSGADQIAAFELVWSRMSEAALDPDESIRLLRQLIQMEPQPGKLAHPNMQVLPANPVEVSARELHTTRRSHTAPTLSR